MIKHILIIFTLILLTNSEASNKLEIIQNLETTQNLSFDFRQHINKKIEKGKCVIWYPGKIFCEYFNSKKILVSNGKSLVIKNKNINSYYVYPLKKTPLFFILDKEYLIDKIKTSKEKIVESKYIFFSIIEDSTEINIFFDKETFQFMGWQTEDIYQNLNIVFISSLKINQKLDRNLFFLPAEN